MGAEFVAVGALTSLLVALRFGDSTRHGQPHAECLVLFLLVLSCERACRRLLLRMLLRAKGKLWSISRPLARAGLWFAALTLEHFESPGERALAGCDEVEVDMA